MVREALYYNHLHGFDMVNSVANFRKAIALNPNYTGAHHLLGSELTHAGLHEHAIEEYKVALRLDPLNDPAKIRLSRALWQSQRFQESLQNYARYNISAIEEAIPLIYTRAATAGMGSSDAVDAAGWPCVSLSRGLSSSASAALR